MRVGYRLIVLGLVVAAVGGMGIHYDSQFDTQWPYPTADELGTDYGTYVGAETLLFGTVKSVNTESNTAYISVTYNGGQFELEVRSFDAEVSQGGTVQVFGKIRADHILVADNVVVVNPAGSSQLYKYVVSLVGAGLVLVVFFRYWQVNTDTLALEVRNDG